MSGSVSQDAQCSRPCWYTSAPVVLICCAGLTTLLIAAESLVALSYVLTELPLAACVLLAAGLGGSWLIDRLSLGRLTRVEHAVLSAAVGVACLPVIIFLLGQLGILGQATAVTLMVLLILPALLRIGLNLQQQKQAATDSISTDLNAEATTRDDSGAMAWLWLIACPFLALALTAACLPPGMLWREEGYGYDVLEYHLAVPKTFFQAGQVHFLPENIYSNFPLHGEMLWYYVMTLTGRPIESALSCQLLNVLLGVLFAASAWLMGRTFSPRAGILAGVVAATSGWLPYLSAIAYVEPGMLAMGMGSIAAVTRARRCLKSSASWLLLAGLLAGGACGFKYTAVPLLLLPVVAAAFMVPGHLRRRLTHLGLTVVGCLLVFSPWLVRNVANTGNPVFPLATSIFGADIDGWDETLAQRWQSAHSLEGISADHRSALGRLVARTAGDPRMGFLIFVLAAIGAARSRDRWTILWVAVLIWQMSFWLLATHQYARFAVVLVWPTITLLARIPERPSRLSARIAIIAILVLSAGWHLVALGRRYYHHLPVAPGETITAYGRLDWFTTGQWPGRSYVGAINELNPQHKVMLVGEARTFYIRVPCEYAVVFSPHPLSKAVAELDDPAAVIRWLRERDVSHVFVHWGEMRRLRRSYGFHRNLDAPLFEQLTEAGLQPVAAFRIFENQPPYATLYEVLQP